MKASSSLSVPEQEQIKVCFSDELRLSRQQIRWQNCGVSLLTKWPFGEGAEIEFGVECKGARHRCVGQVVSCQPHEALPGHFEVILFFVEEPCRDMMAVWLNRQ